MCRCAGEQRRAGIGHTADRAKPMRTKVRKASKGLPVPARRESPSPGRRRPVDALITRCGRRGGDASKARMCRCAGEQCRAGIGRTADRAKPMRTKVRKASKGLPVPASRGSPQPGPTTARRCVDHALRQARRRCQRGTHVPTCWRAAPRRDRVHGRPREADADEGPQGQRGTHVSMRWRAAPRRFECIDVE